MSDKGGFPLVSIFNMDIIIPPANIEFGEDFCFLEFVNEIRDEEKGVCITDSVFIDIAVVLARAKTTILLFDKEEGGCLWGIQRMNFASLQIFIKKVFGCLSFFRRERVYLSNFGFKELVKVYFMVIRAERGDMVCCFFEEH